MSHADVIHTSDANFERDVLRSDVPVVVDFWAEWCGPCKMIGPILDEAARTYAGQVRIAKLNVDENHHTTAKFNIRGIPTLLLFDAGVVVGQKVGALSKSAFTAMLEAHLQPKSVA